MGYDKENEEEIVMDKNQTNPDTKEQDREQIIQLGSDVTKGKDGNIYTLTIIGQVEGHQVLPENCKTTKYEHVLPLLAGIEESDDIDGLLLLLNTVGGDIEAGLAIAEMIADLGKPSVSLVLGGGHSIGVPLAVAAKYSFIASSATMTIHPVRLNGLILGVPQTIEYFRRMQKRITDFVTRNSKISENDFMKLAMNTAELTTDVGTVLDGEEAVKSGLIDKIGNLSDAIKHLDMLINKNKE